MRIDHVFYGHIGGRYPTAEEIEHHVHAARRLRSEAVHALLRDALHRLAGIFRWQGGVIRRPVLNAQHC